MIRIHPSADVSPQAVIGEDTQIWHQAQVRERAIIGRQCIVGKGVYVDFDVHIGNYCKVQNGAFIYHGVTLDEGVFIGPGVILTNDRIPRAINPNGTPKSANDWEVGLIYIGQGAALGAGCIVLPGVTIGEFAMIGAGAVVTRSVPAHGLMVGNPARQIGYVCRCGRRLTLDANGETSYQCLACEERYPLPLLPSVDVIGEE